MNEDTEDLTENEKQASKCLLKTEWRNLYCKQKPQNQANSSDENSVGDKDSSPTKFLKNLYQAKKISEGDGQLESQYISNLAWIKATTVMVERLFSKCRHILTYDQHRMLPKFFEAIVFLKENSDF